MSEGLIPILAVIVLSVLWVFRAMSRTSGPAHHDPVDLDAIPEPPAGAAARPLGKLEEALMPFVEAEAWGEVIHVEFQGRDNFTQLILDLGGVDLYSNGNDVDCEKFGAEAFRLGLTLKTSDGVPLAAGTQLDGDEGPFCVEIRGTWSEVAEQTIRMIEGVYGVERSENVVVSYL